MIKLEPTDEALLAFGTLAWIAIGIYYLIQRWRKHRAG